MKHEDPEILTWKNKHNPSFWAGALWGAAVVLLIVTVVSILVR